ncbi:protein translocase subunit SecD [Pseudonocardia dioxanivorans]|uniref:Multifunctional fusion protein n=1 Tax=Pseudonocardia dioxanivorans (strain ATCC 55486 / DSM 44775 / JCM 13855 / CB1190) TaxID=675635 RepID=F4CNY4_PSEUX|nr:protein translocase subunit SecD [Pseudonocardia dioxanivorans]AEA22789.1 protein-export membrane protein SecD [Pseudonocardia dioxanivorans CB1190]
MSRTSRPLLWRALAALGIVGGATALALTGSPTLGLDLRGGTQIVLETRDAPDVVADAAATDRVLEVLRGRVDGLGVAEPSLTRSGEDRIVVELPGLQDPAEAADVLGRTAQLTIHPVLATTAGEATVDETGAPIVVGPAALVGEDVDSARATSGVQGVLGSVVDVSFSAEGGDRWQALTAQTACAAPGDPARRIAIVLDSQVISSPQVDPSIGCGVGMYGGSTQISGSFSQEQASELAVLIQGGALPVPVEIIEQRTVGPTLGASAIEASTLAALVGTALTALFLLVAYRLAGLVAVVALAGYAVVAYAGLIALGATLTLPGLAGFVLAIGMAVDANVLVAERAREEYARRPRLERASELGYRGAFTAVVDSAVTTLLAGALLFWLASGPVRGFGVTLTLGVVVSLFSALVLSRLLTIWLLRRGAVRRRPRWTGLATIGPVRRRLERVSPDILRPAGRLLACSAVVVVVALAGIALRGLDLGVEFTGGRSVEFSTTNPVDADAARAAVAEAGLGGLPVQTTGDGGIAVRGNDIDDADVAALRASLAAAGGGAQVEQDELIGPSLGAELARGALIALGVALLAQLVYLAIRFRWTFGAGAVAALATNVSIVVGWFAWTGRTIDGVFVAALLTVIGYTVNDSVVVFDRIRAERAGRRREPFHRVAGSAVLSTLPRTVNTGLSTLVILGALLVLGGETLADFALALILGIVAGTVSTVTVAVPLAIVLQRRFGDRDRARPGNRPSGRTGPPRTRPDRRSDGAVV